MLAQCVVGAGRVPGGEGGVEAWRRSWRAGLARARGASALQQEPGSGSIRPDAGAAGPEGWSDPPFGREGVHVGPLGLLATGTDEVRSQPHPVLPGEAAALATAQA